MQRILDVVPALLVFGPLFMVQALQPKSPIQYLIALGGALALALGLAVLFWQSRQQRQRIIELEDQLRRLRNPST